MVVVLVAAAVFAQIRTNTAGRQQSEWLDYV